jgi:hypothetical protein
MSVPFESAKKAKVLATQRADNTSHNLTKPRLTFTIDLPSD